MTPEELESTIDGALTKLLALCDGLAAKDEHSKPAITPKELTEAIKVAVDYWAQRKPSSGGAWGEALTKPANGGSRG